jgi:hypothetical protein
LNKIGILWIGGFASTNNDGDGYFFIEQNLLIESRLKTIIGADKNH